MAENFPNLHRELKIQVHETHGSPNKINLKRYSTRDIIIKLSKIKDKDRMLKAAPEKKLVTCHRRLQSGFLNKNLKTKKEWDDIFQVLKEKPANREYSTRQSCPLKMKMRERLPQTSKPETVPHH